MFKISPIQDENEKKLYLTKCGALPIDGYFAYKMIDEDSGEIMGISQFEICKDYGYISDLKEALGRDDFEAMFILGRATMNFIDLCGPHKCRASATAGNERLIKAIGFTLMEDGEYFADMSDMFSGHCDGKTVDLNEK